MWNWYARDGVVVRTTLGRISDAILKDEEELREMLRQANRVRRVLPIWSTRNGPLS